MTSDIIAVLGSIAAALLALALVAPKLLNMFKGDTLNSNVLDRLAAMEKHAAVQDKRAREQDVKIHRYAVKVTRLMLVVMQLEHLLIDRRDNIPQEVLDEIFELKRDNAKGDINDIES